LRSVELLHRARLAGYTGGKSAVYALAQTLRVRAVTPLVRFEGLAGEFSQHDFGEVWVTYQDGTETKVHFFASRLKYSRWIEVTLVPDERVETLVRALVEHLDAFGGIPLVTVFDRPKTIALKWGRDGVVTEWNPTFAGVALDLSVGVEVCWPYRPQEKGSVENLVGWVKTPSSSSADFLTARIWSGSCASGVPRPIRSGPRAPRACRRPRAWPTSASGCARSRSRRRTWRCGFPSASVRRAW
jgi:transposase